MNLFNTAAFKKPKRNKFDLSHERKFSMNMGQLTPILCQEVSPGEVWKVSTEQMLRFAPLLFPVMHRNNVYIHNFFVPYRLVWDEFQDFITGGRLGTSAPVVPYMRYTNGNLLFWPLAGLGDYLGVPPVPAGGSITPAAAQNISALPFRAYQLIYDEYYRDQNLEASIFDNGVNGCSKKSGDITTANEYSATTSLRYRAWEKDYFTSCLPFAQRGAAVTLPNEVTYKDPAEVFQTTTSTPVNNLFIGTDVNGLAIDSLGNIPNPIASTGAVRIENIDSIANTTINDLRTSVKLQEWLEKNARGGARYIEQILVHFGVLSSDARLQRPEYLGGSRVPVQISEVLSNYQDPAVPDGLPQGSMAGHGIAYGHKGGFTRRFEEHGVIISLMTVLPRTTYSQGIPKMFQRFDKLDYLWPEFANLGEQEVKNKEIFWDYSTATTDNEATFGYQSRYAEYKYIPSTIHGEFRTTLLPWHCARQWTPGTKPTLSASFVKSLDTAGIQSRIFAAGDYDQPIWVQVYHHISAMRPLSYYAIPTI